MPQSAELAMHHETAHRHSGSPVPSVLHETFSVLLYAANSLRSFMNLASVLISLIIDLGYILEFAASATENFIGSASCSVGIQGDGD